MSLSALQKTKLSKSYLHQVMYSANTGINKKGIFSPRTKKLRVELKITDETRSLRHVFLMFKKEKSKNNGSCFLSFQYLLGLTNQGLPIVFSRQTGSCLTFLDSFLDKKFCNQSNTVTHY